MSAVESANGGAEPRTGRIFNVQRFCLHDGPGIRTTVFLKGCPLRCWWCHNPESQAAGPELSVLSGCCIACGACVDACPHGAAVITEGGATVDPALCHRCGRCEEVCPAGGRTLLGRTVTVAEVTSEVERDRDFYEESGGGVTFSGGEPLAQWRFLADCLDACRARGLHTAVDTCGYAPPEAIEAIAERADLFLYDLKLVDEGRHIEATGASNDLILANLRRLTELGRPVWIRTPIVPGLNDDPENLEAMAAFLETLPCPVPVHLLPYHAIGEDKHGRLGREHQMNVPAEAPDVPSVAESLARRGIDVSVGGMHG